MARSFKKRSRTGGRRGTTLGGYRSLFEKGLAASLERRGVDFGYEDTKFQYTLPPKKYLSDFRIGDIFIEAKGYFTSAERTKMLCVREANPGIDIRFVFQRAGNTLSKKSKTTYAQWAEKHGFLWAEGSIPEEWTT